VDRGRCRCLASSPRLIHAWCCPPLSASLSIVQWKIASSTHDGGHEAVASPGNVDDEPVPVAAVAQPAAQRGNVDSEIGRFDEYVGPDAFHQLSLADQITGPFKQNDQDFQSTT